MRSRLRSSAEANEMRRFQRQLRLQSPDSRSKVRMNRWFGKALLFFHRLLWQFRLTARSPLSARRHFRFQQSAGGNASRHNRKDARGKSGAAFWFGETDDNNRTGFWHLIEVS